MSIASLVLGVAAIGIAVVGFAILNDVFESLDVKPEEVGRSVDALSWRIPWA